MSEVLIAGFQAGTKAIEIYDDCCRRFGFNRSLKGFFGIQQLLYAKNATPEGYSVWTLAHSSLNETFNRKRDWFNGFVSADTLKEIWFKGDENDPLLQDKSFRVCFAKTRSGQYVFQGVYVPESVCYELVPDGNIELVRTFKRISRVYPLEEEVIYSNRISIPKTISSARAGTKNAPLTKKKLIESSIVLDKCKIKARALDSNEEKTIAVDVHDRPFQKELIGKTVGETFTISYSKTTYEIQKIIIEV